jgi:alpha-L-rhamnosidase
MHSARRTFASHLLSSASPIPEPYPPLHGGSFTAPLIPASPDPLVHYRWSHPQASDNLQTYVLEPVTTHTENSASFLTSPSHNIIAVEGTGSLHFDFGVASAAWLEFDSPDLSGEIEMSISEYDEPAIVNSGPAHRFKTLAPIRYGNSYRLELNSELYEGVRFGWIHVRRFDRPWKITAVRAVCQAKPTNYLGSFSCSDPMLTRIWYTGAYSVKANLCKDYFGALVMDRGDRISWTGDAHPAQAAALVAFGDWEFIRNNLERSAATNNGIESYSLYWVLSLVDYVQQTGDLSTLRKHADHAIQLLDHAAAIYDNPTITFYGWDERLGAGFEAPDCFETKSAYRMLFVRASLEFAAALALINRTTESNACRQRALHKMQQLRHTPQWYEAFGIHALSDALNTGLTTAQENTAIFAQAFTNRLNRLSFSPFNQYFILQAMAQMNRYEEALTTLLDDWGGQILYGGTTYFETYTPSWNQCLAKNGAVPNGQSGYTSLGHAWGAGVTAWLTREVLGIQPAAAGFSRITIAPHLGATLSSVAGTVPTPLGPVSFAFDQRLGRGSATIPPNALARIGIPASHQTLHKVYVQGHLLWDGVSHPVAGIEHAKLEDDFLYLHDVQPGHYEFSVSYRAPSIAFTPAPLLYPVPTANEDAVTSGSWGGVYGRDGYILFSYDGDHNDRQQLPSYIESVEPSTRKLGTCFRTQVASSTGDPRAPCQDHTNTQIRRLGQLCTGDPVACQQTMTVDVRAAADKHYQVALYFLDWDHQDRRQAIELFDCITLNRLSPVKIVRDFTQGKYLIYNCAGSIRFRIDQVRGKNAVLNALFFDPLSTLSLHSSLPNRE